MNHPLQCQCNTVRGFVDNAVLINRAVCYCRDCQAFAHFLGREGDVLDERGGTDVVQTLPRYITISHGIASIACMRLTNKGLLRWFAGCCGTPIGNTLASPNISFIGLVHTCLANPHVSIQSSFGPVKAWINTAGARGIPKPRTAGLVGGISRLIYRTVKARIVGDYKHNPFFHTDSGLPIVTARVLSSSELSGLMKAVATP